MRVAVPCERCLKMASFAPEEAPAEVACRRCGDARPLKISRSLREQGVVDVCAVCGCGHFYVEKDFNAWIGGAVIVASIAGFVWAQSFNILLGLAFLGGSALLDLVLFWVRPMRTICYRCLATYRGTRPNPEHRTYDLGLAGRFADDYQERVRDS